MADYPNSSDVLLRALFDEQTRLRTELEGLRFQVKQQSDKQGKNEGGGDDKKKDDEKNQKKDEKDKDQKEEQPSKKQKLTHWVRSHRLATVLIILGVLILLIAGYFVMRYLESYESTDDAQVNGHTDPIGARINGFVVAAYVENTYRVKKGQVLVDLDPRDYEVALAQARANLSQAEAAYQAQKPNTPITQTTQTTQVSTAELSIDSAVATLAAAQQTYQSSLSDLQQAEANAANAAAEEERYRSLVGKQEVSREAYDQKATEAKAQIALVESRRATADANQKSVVQAQASLGQAQKRLAEAQQNLPRQLAVQSATLISRAANIATARAQVNQALLNLQYCKIVAPADGIIGDKSVQAGTEVSPGQEMLAVTETNDVWVTANFKETEIRNMRPGQSVTIHVDALSQDFDGYVEALPGATGATYSLLPPENATGNYVKVVQRLPVRIRFKPGQPHEERLAPGMSVEPKVWVQ